MSLKTVYSDMLFSARHLTRMAITGSIQGKQITSSTQGKVSHGTVLNNGHIKETGRQFPARISHPDSFVSTKTVSSA